LAIGHDCSCGLHEKEWRLAIGIMPHLTRMVGIVTTNAIDPIDWKTLAITDNGQGGCDWSGNNKLCGHR